MLAIINRSVLSCGLLSTRKLYYEIYIIIYISISLNNLGNKSQGFEKVIAQLLYILIFLINLKLKSNLAEISHKMKKKIKQKKYKLV